MTPFCVHFLRHGAPARPGRLLGHLDEASTAEGIAACVARADGLAITGVVASDLKRARAPAEAIAAARSLPLRIDPRWRELDFGHWDGLSPSEIDPERLGRFWADPEADRPPGGEHWSRLVARVGVALDALAPEPTLVIAHGGAIRAALATLCNFTTQQLWAFDLPYAALLSVRIWPGPQRTVQIVGLAT